VETRREETWIQQTRLWVLTTILWMMMFLCSRKYDDDDEEDHRTLTEGAQARRGRVLHLPNSRLAAGGDQVTQSVFPIGEKTNRLKKTTASSHILRYARPSSVGRVFFGVLTCVSRRSRRSVMPRVRSSVSFSLQHNVNARTHARNGNLANGAVYSYGILGIVPSASQVPILAVLVPPCDGLGKSRLTVWTHSKAATPILPRVVD
jgi:hypothetical protein